jgi:hypothetical protein
MSSADAAKQASWLRLLLEDLGSSQIDPITPYNTNMGAILLSQNPIHHDRSRHVPLSCHYLQAQVGDKPIELVHVPSRENQANMFTKSLSADLFLDLQDAIGLRNQPLIKWSQLHLDTSAYQLSESVGYALSRYAVSLV